MDDMETDDDFTFSLYLLNKLINNFVVGFQTAIHLCWTKINEFTPEVGERMC